ARTPAFRTGLERVSERSRMCCVCLMCAEREPLDCHRCLLVSRALAEQGLSIGHILADGVIEHHGQTEERLLAPETGPDLFQDRAIRLTAAYRRRTGGAAFRRDF